MPRKRRVDKGQGRRITPSEWSVLVDAPDNSLEAYLLLNPDDLRPLQELWGEWGDAVMARWIAACPGSRPSAWWRWSARGPRLRLGGVGCPAASEARLDLGVPADWLDIDPSDPPRFESQSTFLKRLGLLTPDEARRLTPAAFEPEIVLCNRLPLFATILDEDDRDEDILRDRP